jgi:hypothetical protein
MHAAIANQTFSLTERVFGPKGLSLSSQDVAMISHTFDVLTSKSLDEQEKIAHQLVAVLKGDLSIVDTYKQQLYAAGELISEAVFFKEFLLRQQLAHMQNFITYAGNKPSWSSWAYDMIKKLYHEFIGLFVKTEKTPSFDPIAQDLHRFITLEREEILSDYKNSLLYFYLIEQHPLPQLINVWNTPALREKVKKRAKKATASAQVQWVEMIASLFVQSVVLAGGSLATQWEDDTDKQAFDTAQAEQNKITADWSTFQATLNNDQNQIITNITNAYTQSEKKLNQLYESTNQQLQAEILYLNRSINLDQPITQALDSWVMWDQFFENSVMLTPDNRAWYNLYHFNGGDWEFDSATNSFWQNGLQPFPIPPLWQKISANDTSASIFIDDPATNSIFTEYSTPNNSYTIEIECTLVQCTYPFFIGIMANRGRWISGDPERLWQYRLFGLYGTQTNQSDATTRSIDVCFAQQKLMPEQLPISPLQQIMSDPSTHLFKLSAQEVSSLQINPTTYIFTLVTQPTNTICTLAKKEISHDGNPLITQIGSMPVTDLDPYIFIFGGIGFVAAGCQASFSIRQPSTLQYSADALKKFNQELASQSKLEKS